MQSKAVVVSIGELISKSVSGAPPVFPDLTILVFKELKDNGVYTHTAVCIQLELDVCGNSVEEVKAELVQEIEAYLNAQAEGCSTTEEFVQRVLDNIYDRTAEKDELLAVYHEAKRNYLINIFLLKTI